MRKVYLAAPIFTPQQLEVVEFLKGQLEQREFEVFSPYHNSQAIWAGRAPKDCSPEERAQVLQDNITHLDCELLLCWVGGMGGFTDPGVVWEMGYCKAIDNFHKGVFQLAYIDDTDERPTMNLMLAGTIDAAVRGRDKLGNALDMLKKVDGMMEVSAIYNPDHLVGQEKEPIV